MDFDYQDTTHIPGQGLSRFTSSWTMFKKKIKNKGVFQAARLRQKSLDDRHRHEMKRLYQESVDIIRASNFSRSRKKFLFKIYSRAYKSSI